METPMETERCQAKLRPRQAKNIVTLPGTPEESIMWLRSNLSFRCQSELQCNWKHWQGANPNVKVLKENQ